MMLSQHVEVQGRSCLLALRLRFYPLATEPSSMLLNARPPPCRPFCALLFVQHRQLDHLHCTSLLQHQTRRHDVCSTIRFILSHQPRQPALSQTSPDEGSPNKGGWPSHHYICKRKHPTRLSDLTRLSGQPSWSTAAYCVLQRVACTTTSTVHQQTRPAEVGVSSEGKHHRKAPDG